MARTVPAWARPAELADLIRLAVPIAVTRMSMMLMGITDAIVLGQNDANELPYVLNSWLPIGVALGASVGLLLGVQVLTSELMGQGRTRDSGRIFRRGMVWALGLGAVATAVIYFGAGALFTWLFVDIAPATETRAALAPQVVASRTAHVTEILSFSLTGFTVAAVCSYYLEALRRPGLVTIVSYAGVGLNLVLDLALVAGWWGVPQLGAEGVAWATTVSRWAIAIVLVLACIAYTPAFTRSAPAPRGEASRQASVGTGMAISNVAEWGGFNTTFIIATWISLSANAAYGYAVQVLGVAFMLFLGIGTATSVRVAESFGRHDQAGVRNASRLGVAATLLVGVVLGACVFAGRGPIAGVLVNPSEMVEGVIIAPVIASLLAVMALAMVFDGLQATASMALRAQNVVWLPSAIHILSFFGVMIPVGYLFGIMMNGGAMGMAWAVVVGVVFAGSAQWVRLEMETARRRPSDAPLVSGSG